VSTASWYVIHSKPRKENQVNAYLRTQGFETFYPTLRVQPVNPRASRIRPYFPRYLFVHADLDEVGDNRAADADGFHAAAYLRSDAHMFINTPINARFMINDVPP